MVMNGGTVTAADVEAAAERVQDRVRRTPVLEVEPDLFGTPGRVVVKLEHLQHMGVFKVRGAFANLLDGRVPDAGVIAASGGNHGLSVAYAARELGVTAEVFVPVSSSPVKVARLRTLGAHVTQTGDWYADALAASLARAEQTGARVLHAYDQHGTVAGQGTLGRELAAQAPGVDTVLVAVGGGGLAAGIAAALEGRAHVVGVEPEHCPTWRAASEAGEPVDVEVGGVAADALGARRLGQIPYGVLRRTGASSVLVPDEALREARRLLWDRLRVAAEVGACAPVAALLTGAYAPERGDRVAVIVCGANTDPSDLS
ncbi:MAG: threonine/serine dehydratase [Actinomycetes bacterium]